MSAKNTREETSKCASDEAAAPLSSPVCYADEADPRYMGFAGRDELLAILNELLEAERAGVYVARRTAAALDEPDLKSLMSGIYRDEAHWCGILSSSIVLLGGTPSQKTGAFREKAMAISDLRERLAFLNRGQRWVVKKLKAVLPTIQETAIYTDLAAMLASHEVNIDRVETALPGNCAE
jgi:hypothetical protein